MSVLGFFLGGDMGPCRSNWSGVPRIVAIAAPGDDSLYSGDSWLLGGCLGLGGGESIESD